MAASESLPTPFLEHIAERFRVLGEATRLQILQSLMNGPKSVTEVVAETGKGQANVSKHLHLLAAAGIVARTRSGNLAIYRVVDPMVFDLCKLVCGSVKARLVREVRTADRMLKAK